MRESRIYKTFKHSSTSVLISPRFLFFHFSYHTSIIIFGSSLNSQKYSMNKKYNLDNRESLGPIFSMFLRP